LWFWGGSPLPRRFVKLFRAMSQPRRCLLYVDPDNFAGGGSGACEGLRWKEGNGGEAHLLSNLYIIVAGSAGVMGRIKTDMVKRTASKIVKAYPNKFGKDFQRNKEALNEVAEVRSKKLRNVIAGYTVRLKKQGDELKPKARKKPSFGRGGFGRGAPRGPPRGRR